MECAPRRQLVEARYLKAAQLNARLGTKLKPGEFTPWESLPKNTDLLFYEGLHGAVVTPEVNIAKHPDLLIGVVPVINLEWIQKLWRDKSKRGYSTEAVTDTILRRMPDYVNYICPQFAHTHVNFQRVPCVDTSNPFIAREIPAPDESFVVIRFANPKGIVDCEVTVYLFEQGAWHPVPSKLKWDERAPIMVGGAFRWEDTDEIWPDSGKPKRRKVGTFNRSATSSP